MQYEVRIQTIACDDCGTMVSDTGAHPQGAIFAAYERGWSMTKTAHRCAICFFKRQAEIGRLKREIQALEEQRQGLEEQFNTLGVTAEERGDPSKAA